MMRQIFYFACLLLLIPGALTAQDRFPEFFLTQDNNFADEDFFQDDADVSINLQKPLMRDVIYLQEQINLLEGLVERQAEINEIANNYENSGVRYTQPAPPKTACEKLPSNLLCFSFYPDLEKNTAFFEYAEKQMITNQQNAINASLQNYDLGGDNVSQNNNDTEPRVSRPMIERYGWSDLQCVQDDCSALVISASDSGKRFRVSDGDTIFNDIKIKSVSKSGVTIIQNNQDKVLKPYAVMSNTTETANRNNDLEIENVDYSDVLRNNNSERTQNQVSANNEPDDVNSLENDAPQPMLGPTGLF